MLGADHHRSPADGGGVRHGQLLEGPGGEHPGRSVAGDEPGAAGALPRAGGEHHGPCHPGARAVRRRQRQSEVVDPAHRDVPGAQLDAGRFAAATSARA